MSLKAPSTPKRKTGIIGKVMISEYKLLTSEGVVGSRWLIAIDAQN